MKRVRRFSFPIIVILSVLAFCLYNTGDVQPVELMKLGERIGMVYGVERTTTNEDIFKLYPSDGSAFNEIHRYYGSCSIFGDVAAACYDAGNAGKTKNHISRKLAVKYWILSQGQIDVCNMMFNKGAYDRYMNDQPLDNGELTDKIHTTCNIAIDNINKEQFNRDFSNSNNQ